MYTIFVLVGLTLRHIQGSGKSLLLLALLGEADLLAGQIISPRSPPDTLALFSDLPFIAEKDWIVPGICAYVPQTAWLQNASIRDNILFNLPMNEKRYQETLEVGSSFHVSVRGVLMYATLAGMFPYQ